jgi:hypothetical protein
MHDGGEAAGAEPGSLSVAEAWEAEQVAVIRAALERPAVRRAVTDLMTGQDDATQRERRLAKADAEMASLRLAVNRDLEELEP